MTLWDRNMNNECNEMKGKEELISEQISEIRFILKFSSLFNYFVCERHTK